MIEMNCVSYAYEGIAALNNITLRIAQGEAVALMGANGSGKSTLLKVINGIVSPDSGSYCFNGEAVTKEKLKDAVFSKGFHQKIGFVFQNSDTQLFCSTVYDEIAFGPRQMGMDETDVADRVQSCLELLNLEGFENRQPYHLSGGEKKKVAVAAVLAMNPDVLVLDEPMNGLDPRTQRWLVEFLSQLNRAGKTVITSTHNLELIHEISTRAILFNEQHSLEADLPTKELLKDIDLLKRVNLIDAHYHQHEGHQHIHFHQPAF